MTETLPTPNNYVTLTEAAQATGLSVSYIRNLIVLYELIPAEKTTYRGRDVNILTQDTLELLHTISHLLNLGFSIKEIKTICAARATFEKTYLQWLTLFAIERAQRDEAWMTQALALFSLLTSAHYQSQILFEEHLHQTRPPQSVARQEGLATLVELANIRYELIIAMMLE